MELLCRSACARHLLLGGRFTDALARYFAAHLGLVRPGVRHVPSGAGVWRDRLLDISRRDVLIVFDIRRYQDDVITFARSATSRGAAIVLVTDQWLSPLSRQAAHVLPCRVAAPSRWGLQRRPPGDRRSADRGRDRTSRRIRQEEDRGTGEAPVKRRLLAHN